MTFLLSCAIRMSILLTGGLLLASCLRSRSAALRHLVLTVATISAAAVPALMLLMPAHSVEVWPESARSEQQGTSLVVAPEPALLPPQIEPHRAEVKPGDVTSTSDSLPLVPVQQSDDRTQEHQATPALDRQITPVSALRVFASSLRVDLISILGIVWWAGALFGLVRLLLGVLHLRRFVRSQPHLTADTRWSEIAKRVAMLYALRRPIELYECSNASILATWGIFRPRLLLPAGAEHWPEDRIQIVIHHELAHIQRGDWLIQVVAEVQRAIYWFNPLHWIVCRQLVRESEQACDDVALRHGIGRSEYAGHLLELARTLKAPQKIWSAALSMARESTLERRFAAILNPGTDRNAARGFVVLATIVFFAGLAIPLASLRAVAAVARATESVARIESPTSSVSAEEFAAVVETTPTIPPGQTQTGAPSIRGIVTRFGTSDPVPEASVELRKAECGEGGTPAEVYTALTNLPNPYWTQGAGPLTAPQVIKTTTNENGRFTFENLTAGKYCIVAFRGGGYLAAEYLQRSFRGPGSTIALAEGQQLTNINLALVPTGSISGRVTDARGEPVANALVLPLEPVMYEGRRRLNVAMSTVQTNDLGEFRLYWLTPGRYYIAATVEDSERRTIRCCTFPSGRLGREELLTYPIMKYRELEDGSMLEETFAYVYYGSGTDPEKALPVEVKPGLNTPGIDIPVAAGKQRSWHVRGTVTNGATGQPAANVSVRLMPREWIPNPIVPSTLSDAGGTFEIPGVIPGAYFLYATGYAGQRGSVSRAGEPIPVPELIARTPVTVGGADVNGVRVVINAGFNLPGRVSIEGLSPTESAASLSQIRVRPLRDPDIFGQPAALTREPVPSAADGSFTLTGIGPGDYRVFVEPFIIAPRIVPPPPPPGPLQLMYVKAIRFGNLDVLSQGLHITGPLEGQLEVVIGKAGEVRGRVIDSRQQAVINATVAAIPEASMRNRPDLYKKTRTDASGSFRMFGIAPGDYKLFAWEQVEDGIWLDADFIRPFENRGRAIRVNETRTENVDVLVIPR